MFKRILAATDFSDKATAAWHLAADLALIHQGELALVYVIPGAASPATPADASHETHAAERRLAEHVQHAADQRVPARGTVLRGDPVDAILAMAEENKTDLIVLGRPGGAQSGFLVGSVADRVARRATCPVLTVGVDPWRLAPARSDERRSN